MSTKYLSLALVPANEAATKRGAFGGRELKEKDYANLTSEMMIHIVSNLLAHLDPSFTEKLGTQGQLHNMRRLGFAANACQYNARPEKVFRACRKFFPPENDLLDMSSFVVPHLDPKRAKQIIIFLVGYVLRTEQINERFEKEWEKLNEENQVKSRLYSEIEDLKTQINEEIMKLQGNKDAKPQLEQQLREFERLLLKQQTQLANLEQVCSQEKRNYDSKASVNRRLQEEVDNLKQERAELESLIVDSPDQLFNDQQMEAHKLKDDKQKRDVLGSQLREIGLKVQSLTKVSERANLTLQKFNELIGILQAAGDSVEVFDKASREYQNKRKQIENMQGMLSQMDTDQTHLESEINKRMEFYKEELGKLSNLVNQRQGSLEELEFLLNETNSRLDDIDNDIATLRAKISVNVKDLSALKAEQEFLFKNYDLTVKSIIARGNATIVHAYKKHFPATNQKKGNKKSASHRRRFHR